MTTPIDPSTFNTLLDSIGGDRAFLAELVATFLTDGPVQLEALHAALARGDAETCRRAAHSLKSNAASFGALALAALCKELEDVGRSGDLAAAPELLARVEAEFASVRAALEILSF